MRTIALTLLAAVFLLITGQTAHADSVNSPNITLNVDTNRIGGAGAGQTAVNINTITIAETTLPEYSAGTGKAFVFKVRPGYQFVPGQNVTAQSTTVGFNNLGINVAAPLSPTGVENETLTFNITSGTNTTVQDIVRVNGIRLRILNATGAAGPAQTTMQVTTSTAGGAFTNQGIVAANIAKGAADRLQFAIQPGSNQAGADLLPQVKIVDFGGNILTNDSRTISLALQVNPGSATLLGTAQRSSGNGLATWTADDDLNITTAAAGYTLRASHSGAPFLSSDTADSNAFTISAGNPGGLTISSAPPDTSAGGDILLTVTAVDEFDNPTTVNGLEVSLDSAVNPGGWPLLVDTSLTKSTVNGVAQWAASDHLRITKAITGYQLSVSGLGASVLTSTFNIVPGTASLLRFVQQPGNTEIDAAVSPPVSVDIIDAFGNRTASTEDVTLSLITSPCIGTLSGNVAAASGGLATFPALASDTACDGSVLSASVASSNINGTSEPFDFKALDADPVALKSLQLKFGKLLKFSARGTLAQSTRAIDNPTKRGAVITVEGTSGTARYSLPKSGWKAVGKGFQFSGPKCESVTITKKAISAVCKGRTGGIDNTEEGPVNVELKVGKGTKAFCGQCGGTFQGDLTKVYQRANCDAPAICP